MQQYGVNYWEKYSPTVNWISVRFLMIVAKVFKLYKKAIYFVLAFPQADLDVPVYMELPAGMDLAGHEKYSSKYLLKLKKCLYGFKNASLNWHNNLKDAFEDRGFMESLSDPCIFISKDMIILVYVDDCIIISQEDFTIQKCFDSMKDTPEGFEFMEEGTTNALLGVEISPFTDGKEFPLSQPFLIDLIIQALDFDPNTTKGATNNTPSGYPLLNKDEMVLPGKHLWKYCGIIGILGYFQETTRPDTEMATNQCARFNNDTHLSQEIAVNRIGRYPLDTRDKGMIYRPDTSRGLECYVDTDFSGGWKYGDHDSMESVLSRTGFVIMCDGRPIHLGSKMKTEISLSTTESDYIALSTSTR